VVKKVFHVSSEALESSGALARRTITMFHSGTTKQAFAAAPRAANVRGGAAGQAAWPFRWCPFVHH